jgi:hypothetical protein
MVIMIGLWNLRINVSDREEKVLYGHEMAHFLNCDNGDVSPGVDSFRCWHR